VLGTDVFGKDLSGRILTMEGGAWEDRLETDREGTMKGKKEKDSLNPAQ